MKSQNGPMDTSIPLPWSSSLEGLQWRFPIQLWTRLFLFTAWFLH